MSVVISPTTLAQLEQQAAAQNCTVEMLIQGWLHASPSAKSFPSYAEILDHASDFVALFGRDLRYIYVNSAVEHLLGLPPAQVLGRTHQELGMPAPQVAQWETLFAQILDTGQAQSLIFDSVGSAGKRTYEAQVTPIANESGEILHFLNVTRDVTRYAHAEQGLHHSEARLRSILDLQTTYVIRVDLAGNHTYSNDSYQHTFGWLYQNGDSIGQPALTAIVPLDHEKTRTALETCLANPGQPISLILRKPKPQPNQFAWTKWEFVALPVGPNGAYEVQCMGFDITEQKQAEEALVEERKLFFTGPSVVFKLHNAPQWPIAYVSPNIAQQFGYDAAELISQNTFYDRLIHPDDLPLMIEEVRLNSKMGTDHFVQEYRLADAGGGYRWVYDYTTIVRDDAGKVKYVQGYVLDVTGQREAQEKLRRSEARQRAMLAAIPDMMFRIRVDGTYLDYHIPNPSLLGMRPAQLLGRKLAEIFPHPAIPTHLHYIQHVVNTGEPIRFNYQLEIGDQRRYFEAHMVRSGADEALTIVRDVTDRVQTQKQVQLHLLALETAANAIVITDRNGLIEWVNPAFTVLTGYTASEAVGKNPSELVKSGQHPPEYYANMWQTITAGQVWSGRTINRHKNGTLYTEEQTITPVLGEFGRITHFIAIKQDARKQELAEQMALEKERLLVSLKREQEYNATVQHVIDTLAHDLRTPLTVIAAARDLLSQYYDRIDAAKRQQKLDTIGQQLTYVTELLNDLTLVAGSSLNHRMLQPHPLNAAALCQLMVEEMAESVGRNHHLSFENVAGVETAVLDEVLLNRILLNLLSNAIKYSPADSQIKLQMVADGRNWLIFRVTDQGHGIAEPDLARIFQPFYRTEAVRASHIAGTGLGLSIVQNCVEQHHGRIEVASTLGEGTTFTVRLPSNLTPTPA